MKKENLTKILAFAAVIFIMFCGYVVNKRRAKIIEASKLPFHNVELSQVEDGTYSGKTYTSFAHVQLEVTVENGHLVKIDATECDGLEVVKSKDILQEMVAQNKIVVPAKKGSEIGTMIFISCIDSALHGEQVNDRLPEDYE